MAYDAAPVADTAQNIVAPVVRNFHVSGTSTKKPKSTAIPKMQMRQARVKRIGGLGDIFGCTAVLKHFCFPLQILSKVDNLLNISVLHGSPRKTLEPYENPGFAADYHHKICAYIVKTIHLSRLIDMKSVHNL